MASIVDHRNEITAEMLRAILHYDPLTGVFTWVANRGRKTCKGTIAGNFYRGRRSIGVYGWRCQSSNLAWLYIKGEWPVSDVDHKDRNPNNDRWINLRIATRSQNCMNQTVRKITKSGHKGVTPHKNGLWRARISAPGCRYELGLYREKEYAAAAYRIAAAAIHGEFSGV